MPAETSVRVGGTWRKIPTNGLYVRVAGVWQQIDYAYMRSGGIWRTTYIRDATGPAAPTDAKATWNTLSGTPIGTPSLLIQWTNPPDPDYAFMRVSLWPIGQPFLPSFDVSSGTNFVHYTAYVPNNVIFNVTLTPYDSNGNAGTPVSFNSNAWTGLARGRTPSPFVIDPVDSGTLRSGIWRTDAGVQPNNRRVYQGASASGVNYGAYLYGDQIMNALSGSTIAGATLSYFRVNSGGQGAAVQPEMWWSPNLTSKAVTDPVLWESKLGTGVAINGSTNPWATTAIDPDWYGNLTTADVNHTIRAIIFASGDQTLQPSIGNVSFSYAQFYGVGEVPGTVVPGRIVVTHNG